MTMDISDPPLAQPPQARVPTQPERPLHARRARTFRSISALMLREMSTTYGRSPGGYVWALLEPIGAIAMFTLIISVGLRLRVPSVGVSFELFFATGILTFRMAMRTASQVAASISYSRALLFYPSVTYSDAVLARFLLQVITHCTIFVIVITGIVLIFDTRAMPYLPSILASLTMAATLGLGLGVLNAYLFPMFPLWKTIWGIVTTPLFFMSTVIYAYEDLPAFGRDLIWYNPLVHIVGMMRRGLIGTYDAPWISPAYVFGLAFVMMLIGFAMLGRYYRAITNREFD